MSDATTSGAQDERLTGKSRNGATPAIALAKRLGLRHVTTDALSIRRRRCGRGWAYIRDDGQPIQDVRVVRRLARLAVPPAYRDVLYAADPAAHLQAIGRDAAGRLQYRYHPEWDHVRELRKDVVSICMLDLKNSSQRGTQTGSRFREFRRGKKDTPAADGCRALIIPPLESQDCCEEGQRRPERPALPLKF